MNPVELYEFNHAIDEALAWLNEAAYSLETIRHTGPVCAELAAALAGLPVATEALAAIRRPLAPAIVAVLATALVEG
ncbi:MAG: hypothetical protein M5U01_09455 [Ardenticatenaceae bacterium]|nr:hypothetical protein [Ardenticatenaceae bacterium]